MGTKVLNPAGTYCLFMFAVTGYPASDITVDQAKQQITANDIVPNESLIFDFILDGEFFYFKLNDGNNPSIVNWYNNIVSIIPAPGRIVRTNTVTYNSYPGVANGTINFIKVGNDVYFGGNNPGCKYTVNSATKAGAPVGSSGSAASDAINLCDVFNAVATIVKTPPYNPPYTNLGITGLTITAITGDNNSGSVNLSLTVNGTTYNALFDYKLSNGVYYLKLDANNSLEVKLFVNTFLNTTVNNAGHAISGNTITIIDNYGGFGLAGVKLTFVTDSTGTWYTAACTTQTAAGSSGVAAPSAPLQANAADSWLSNVQGFQAGGTLFPPSGRIGSHNIIAQGTRFWW